MGRNPSPTSLPETYSGMMKGRRTPTTGKSLMLRTRRKAVRTPLYHELLSPTQASHCFISLMTCGFFCFRRSPRQFDAKPCHKQSRNTTASGTCFCVAKQWRLVKCTRAVDHIQRHLAQTSNQSNKVDLFVDHLPKA